MKYTHAYDIDCTGHPGAMGRRQCYTIDDALRCQYKIRPARFIVVSLQTSRRRHNLCGTITLVQTGGGASSADRARHSQHLPDQGGARFRHQNATMRVSAKRALVLHALLVLVLLRGRPPFYPRCRCSWGMLFRCALKHISLTSCQGFCTTLNLPLG